MTKNEYIEKFGIEWYNDYLKRAMTRRKEKLQNDTEYHEKYLERRRNRYKNDLEYRNKYKNWCNETARKRHKLLYNVDVEYTTNERLRKMKKYVRQGEFTKIENYDKAKADNFKGWCIHHRLELTLDGDFAQSVDDLKRMDMYYDRPYFELIFLPRSEHMKLHKGNNYNERI